MRIDVLGSTTLTDRTGRPVSVIGEKARVLLTLLACRGDQVTSTGLLTEALWGERPPRSSTANLQTYIWRIRSALSTAHESGAERLVHRSGSYELRLGADECDLLELEQLAGRARRCVGQHRLAEAAGLFARAASLWRGDPFPPASADRSMTVAGEARRCIELRLGVCEDLAVTSLRLGEPTAPIPTLRRLVAEHPIRERLHAALIRCLWAAGDYGAALAAYRDARAVLHRELGTEPGAELRELRRSMQRA